MPEIQVSKKTIKELFEGMQNKKFIIPDYQRPYSWDIEKCSVLWDDITNFFVSKKDREYYYMGTIVTFLSDNLYEVIDGQQRITTFILLLRAIYQKLEEMKEKVSDQVNSESIAGLINQIGKCIWDVDDASEKVKDKALVHLASNVISENENTILMSILDSGTVNENNKDNYSKNYSFFRKKLDDFAKNNPMEFYSLCVTILKNCRIFPIDCDEQETALTIFNTLNDRGMQLSDSDIFKAQLYQNVPEDNKKFFNDKWRNLKEICDNTGYTIDDIFRFYTHVLRARNKDRSKEIGLRKFYSSNNYELLKNQELLNEITILASFWEKVSRIHNEDEEDVDFFYNFSNNVKKLLHVLSFYTNDFWQYPVSVFFMSQKNKNKDMFNKEFELLLKKLVAYLFSKFIEKSTVGNIKSDIYSACVMIDEGKISNLFDYSLKEDEIKRKINDVPKLTKALLLLYAYLNEKQVNLVSEKFDIEHIFPKKWQNTNYNNWDIDSAQIYLDNIGNKVVLEKKINIQAGNGYFERKKSKYKKSDIACVKEIAEMKERNGQEKTDWLKDDIVQREKVIVSKLINYFKYNL